MTQTQAFDITNPLVHRRVIFDGITNTAPIGIDPGETRRGVVLADHVYEKLLAVTDDLKLTPTESVALTPPTADAGIETVPRAAAKRR